MISQSVAQCLACSVRSLRNIIVQDISISLLRSTQPFIAPRSTNQIPSLAGVMAGISPRVGGKTV